MRILAYGITDVGRIREINEDSFCVEGFKDGQPLGYALLADGMGGHNAGEVASSTAVEVVKGELEKTIDVKEHDKIVYNIMSSIDYANTKVYDLSKHDRYEIQNMFAQFLLRYSQLFFFVFLHNLFRNLQVK